MFSMPENRKNEKQKFAFAIHSATGKNNGQRDRSLKRSYVARARVCHIGSKRAYWQNTFLQ